MWHVRLWLAVGSVSLYLVQAAEVLRHGVRAGSGERPIAVTSGSSESSDDSGDDSAEEEQANQTSQQPDCRDAAALSGEPALEGVVYRRMCQCLESGPAEAARNPGAARRP